MTDELIGKKLNTVDLLDYQDGAVVSREIIRKETGTVTLMAFEKGEGLSEHTAPFDAMVHVVDGKADINIDGKSSILEEGEMNIMPANVPHALMAIEDLK